MLTKANTGISGRDANYLEAIDECLKEMSDVRKSMKKLDAEVRQLRASSRRKLDETWATIRRVQAAV